MTHRFQAIMSKRKMRDAWLENDEFVPWLCRVEADPTKAWCNICKKEFGAEISTIKRHRVSTVNVQSCKQFR